MTCEAVRERLDDYLDGELGEAEFQDIELHLASCAACREEERGRRAVVALAAALPRRREPPRDLWPAIAGEIASPRRFAALSFVDARPAARWTAGLAAAAAVVLAVWVASREAGPGLETAGPAPRGVARPAAAGGDLDAFAEAEREYQRATGELMALLDARRAALSPGTSAAIDENLAVIDRALAEIRAAREHDPASARLGRLLVTTHQKKIATLRRVLKLTT
ncbi:MAG TPA: zf-HC2 domain-containing protein [Vicinamibacteria bacterium]|nr:zf-HC2 domain-containing protein [Vicinamibacteria bacterium]